jgi:hypothetical protein
MQVVVLHPMLHLLASLACSTQHMAASMSMHSTAHAPIDLPFCLHAWEFGSTRAAGRSCWSWFQLHSRKLMCAALLAAPAASFEVTEHFLMQAVS